MNFPFKQQKSRKKMHLFLSRSLADLEVTPEQWTILNIIQQKAPISQKQLAELSEKDTPTVNRIIDVLLRKDLVIRKTDEVDRRKTLLSLNEKGEKLTSVLQETVEEACKKMFADFSEQDLRTFATLLNQIENNIE
ncbi:MarR family winged helix-turn-helix transcriptional regulator [Listeria aquatica]|uniref:MarR family transcriptional regulator n=1 Tax=Listeria aquatica FSL S10-1188 TaxID=1265818 RepID=W7B3Z6_9LIST|nr:MarR family transcriptional regulator [Listeria aquatica]EUJ17466.1 MarR family transcriptional regulator [Listeria aquatica FSL S10-1188]